MTIEAKIIADSIGPNHPRLTTFQLKYPRFIHAEFMTHRAFSRNASSSRAIPVEKQIEMLLDDTAMPSHWGKNQSGMQAEEEQTTPVAIFGEDRPDDPLFGDGFGQENGYVCDSPAGAWTEARDLAVMVARGFVRAGYHKQIVNRILEPFSHISVVCTATDYDNFFWLRRHKDAQPEIKILADVMYEAQQASTPRALSYGDWHLPYVTEADWAIKRPYRNGMEQTDIGYEPISIEDLVKISVARCARVSYLTHDGQTPSITKDLELYDRLVGSSPLHASPAEHQATPDELIWNSADLKDWENPHLHGNLTGYQQFRKTLPGEHHTTWEGLNDLGS